MWRYSVREPKYWRGLTILGLCNCFCCLRVVALAMQDRKDIQATEEVPEFQFNSRGVS